MRTAVLQRKWWLDFDENLAAAWPNKRAILKGSFSLHPIFFSFDQLQRARKLAPNLIRPIQGLKAILQTAFP
jgi:hypothetical protein